TLHCPKMSHLLVAFAVSATVSLVLTPVARGLAWRWRALDEADGLRKLQASPVPYLGGLALYVALLAGSGIACLGQLGRLSLTVSLIASATLICLVGWCDDRYGLRVRWKLLGQVLATLPLVLAGQTLTRLECCGWVVELGWWGVPLTIAWLVAGANAINFIDGVDGLASTLGLIAAAMIALIASRLENTDAVFLAVVLAGGLAGFLQYNWQPATIYLGDAGSMTIGFWLAALAIAGSRSSMVGCRLIVLIALLAVPLADVGLAVIRRLLDGRRFWLPDRGHLHHRLLDRGWGAGKIVATLAAVSLASGAIAFAAAVHGRELLAWGALAMILVALVRFDLLGNHELDLAGQFLARRLLDVLSIVSAGRLTRSLPTAEQLDQSPLSAVWAMFIAELELHQVEHVELSGAAAGGAWRHQWRRSQSDAEPRPWAVEVSFRGASGADCRLRAVVSEGAGDHPLNWLSLMEVLRVYGQYWADHFDQLLGLDRGGEPSLTIGPPTSDDRRRAA
ncbi:MAG TPA: MraY family glycosyltransferase, partial [Pirellulales bacterium]|nr:MraY family glycosyltransferase [Pirellulales bacterium]